MPMLRAEQIQSFTLKDAQIAVNAAISQSKIANLLQEPEGWISKGIVNVVQTTAELPVWNGDQAGRFYYDASTDELWMGTSTNPYKFLVTGPGFAGFSEGQDIKTLIQEGGQATDFANGVGRTFEFVDENFANDGSDSFVYLNGSLQKSGNNDDFNYINSSTIQFNFDLTSTDRVSIVFVTTAYMTNYTTKAYVGSTAAISGATRIGVYPIGNLNSNTVQSALEELQQDIDMITGGSNLTYSMQDAYEDGSVVTLNTNDVDFRVPTNKSFKISDGTGSIATAAYQVVDVGGNKSVADNTGLNSATQYFFREHGVEYSITTGLNVTYGAIIMLMNDIVPNYKFEIREGNLVCVSKILGSVPSVQLADGLSSPRLLSTLTNFVEVRPYVAGTDSISASPILDVNNGASSTTITAYADILPANQNVDLGSSSNKFGSVWAKDAHFDTNTIYLGSSAALKVDNDSFKFTVDGGTTYAEIPKANIPNQPTVVQASADQPLSLATTGTGQVELSSETKVSISSPVIELTGNIIPTTTNLYDIGSDTHKIANVYAEEVHVGASSLYVNGKKVISDISDTMTFATEVDQSMNVKTQGVGNLVLMSQNEINAQANGGLEWTVPSTLPSKNIEFTNQSANGQILLNTTDQIDMTASLVEIHSPVTITGALTANLTGAVTGNASSATKLATARSISLSGDVAGSVDFDGTANVTITTTVADNSHNHTSANISDATNLSTANMIVKRDASGGFSAGTITANLTGDVTGALTGNASTATKLATSRTIELTGDVTGSASFDGTASASIAAVIADNSHNHTSANISDATSANTANMIIKRDSSGGFSAGAISASDLTLSGNLTVNGTTTTIDTTNLLIEDNVIVINKNQTGTPPTGLLSGIEIERGDSTNYQFLFRESDDSFVIGEPTSLQAVATREDTPTTNAIPFWNNTLKRFDSSGVTVSGSTLTATLSGNASTASSAAKLTTARTIGISGKVTGTATSFDGTGNITISTTAASILSSEVSDATNLSTANMIVKRDASGGFSAGTITATLSGNASTATLASSATKLATSRTIELTGDVTGSASFDGTANASITAVIADNSHNHTSANISDATNLSTANMIVKRDASGGFSAGTITANLTGAVTGNASTATKLATARTINGVSFDGTANITITAASPNLLTRGTYLTGSNYDGSAATTWAVDATNLNTASKVVARDASGNFSAGTITANLTGNVTGAVTGNASTASAFNSARKLTINGAASTTINTTSSDGNYTLSIAGVKVNSAAAADAVAWSGITSKPTTMAGYAITDGVLTSGNGMAAWTATNGNLTISLGTPGSCTNASTNATTATSHTHAITTVAPSSTTAGVMLANGTAAAGHFYGGTANPTNVTRLNYDGYFYATRVYNVVWNDLAEFMLKAEESEPGMVLIQTENGVAPASSRGDGAVIGVYSDTYGYALGAEDQENKVSVGLAGRVNVWIEEPCKIGDLLISSDKKGFATVKRSSEDGVGKVFAKVMEIKTDNTPQRVSALIMMA